MQYTQLGRSGLVVSRIGLGCMSYGSPAWRPWVLDEPAAQPFFRRAIEAGINFFDTADMYSQGASEEITGRALKQYGRRDELVIATKVHYPMGDGPNLGGLSRKHILDGIVNSVGIGGKKTGQFVYKYIDQGLVDGAVNGSGATARGAGGALQPVQSGKVNLYGALLFGAAAIGALVLVIVNI